MYLGRYVVTGEIGRGAMGLVYRGEDPTIGRPVAIKTVNPAALTDPSHQQMLRERLVREARSAALLSHPGIVTIYDVIETGDMACMVMEFVDGESLAMLLSRGPLPRETALALLLHIAAALDFAHQNGVIHRDIKPANILLTQYGYPKIADFGIARVTSRETTLGIKSLGTPAYMSPEQIRDEPVTPRSDQFALGVLAFELLTGRKPYDSDQVSALIYKVLEEPPPPSGLGPAVDATLRRALAKPAAQRFPTCLEFVIELRRVLDRSAIEAAPPTPEPGARWKPALAGVLSFVLLCVVFWFRPKAPSPAPAKGASAVQSATRTEPAPRNPAPPVRAVSAVTTAPHPAPAASRPPVTQPPVTPPPAAVGQSWVRISSTPPGARLVFNGDAAGCLAPCERDLPPGTHSLTASLDGYRPVNTKFETPGTPDIAIILQKADGVLAFDESLRGARVFVAGRELPATAPTEAAMGPGDYPVRVVFRDTVLMDRVITVRPGGRVLVRAPAAEGKR